MRIPVKMDGSGTDRICVSAIEPAARMSSGSTARPPLTVLTRMDHRHASKAIATFDSSPMPSISTKAGKALQCNAHLDGPSKKVTTITSLNCTHLTSSLSKK
jgi:hypothetical protein